MDISWLGWIGSVAFAVCGIPLAVETIRKKRADINTWTVILWTLGEICTLGYVLLRGDWPLVPNYAANLLCLVVVIYYKIKRAE